MSDYEEQIEQLDVRGIKRMDFQAWKHHPVSKLFFEFLRDKRKFIEQIALEQWISGQIKLDSPDQATRGQVIELTDIEGLQFEQIYTFYQGQLDSNGTEDPQDRVS